ncbi:MAG: DoxX family protein [Chloroflexota bacterium]|jgi:uncharacterized membrane protein YphA (DoxX/SURF4 family)|nr:DoxX family protein [Chloroflexota bacterium]
MLLIILSITVALAYVMTGGLKIRMIPMARVTADRLGYPRSMIRVVGLLEVGCAALVLGGIWVRWMGILGALLLIATMIGAIVSRARVHDTPRRFIPAVVLGTLCVVLLVMHL